MNATAKEKLLSNGESGENSPFSKERVEACLERKRGEGIKEDGGTNWPCVEGRKKPNAKKGGPTSPA